MTSAEAAAVAPEAPMGARAGVIFGDSVSRFGVLFGASTNETGLLPGLTCRGKSGVGTIA